MGSQENWTRAQNGVRDYSCWQTTLSRTPACFACASLGFSFACTLLVFSFACVNSERLWTVSCGVCMFLRRVTEFATRFKNSWIRPCCNPWKLQWQVAGAPNLFGRPLIPYDFLKRIVTSKFRNIRNLMSVFFQVVENVVLATEKKVTYNFHKGDKT